MSRTGEPLTWCHLISLHCSLISRITAWPDGLLPPSSQEWIPQGLPLLPTPSSSLEEKALCTWFLHGQFIQYIYLGTSSTCLRFYSFSTVLSSAFVNFSARSRCFFRIRVRSPTDSMADWASATAIIEFFSSFFRRDSIKTRYTDKSLHCFFSLSPFSLIRTYLLALPAPVRAISFSFLILSNVLRACCFVNPHNSRVCSFVMDAFSPMYSRIISFALRKRHHYRFYILDTVYQLPGYP